MERFQEHKQKAVRNLEIGEHMLTVTYPLLKDTKLLLGVCENIFLALTNIMSSVVYHELTFKRVPPFQDDFDSKFSVFNRRIVPRYGVKKDYIDLLRDMKELVLKHKKSPVEFVRKDKFIICDDNYEYEAIDAAKLRKYLDDAKEFYKDMSKITEKHENIFKRRSLR
jgi:hypothetical protein